jgi:hypothetical protein
MHDIRRLNQVTVEVFTAVTMKNAVFWDVNTRRSRKNRRCLLQLLVTANVPSWPVLVTLMKKAICSRSKAFFKLIHAHI